MKAFNGGSIIKVPLLIATSGKIGMTIGEKVEVKREKDSLLLG